MTSSENFCSVREEGSESESSLFKTGVREECSLGEVELPCDELHLRSGEVGRSVVYHGQGIAFECCGGEDINSGEWYG